MVAVTNTMELKDLVGKHVLDAVDFETIQVKTWGDQFESANCIRFRLDGVVYIAVEDPDDGYRSCLGELKVAKGVAMTNVFPKVRVVGKHRTVGKYNGKDDILELVDSKTGEVILEVGTDDIDDYYPGFVSHFRPEAMSVNKPKKVPSKVKKASK